MRKAAWISVLGLLALTAVACDGDDTDASKGGASNSPAGADGASPGSDLSESDDPVSETEGMAGMGGDVASLGVPVMCTSEDDCPEGIACVLPAGGGVGFCDVNEMQVDAGAVDSMGDEEASDEETSGGSSVSLGAPAPCTTDADCGVATCNTELGYCQIEEMRVEP